MRSRVALGGAIGIALAALVLGASGRTARADAAQLCDAEQDGWSVLTDVSSDSAEPTGFLCNYRVQRPAGLSGVAITIEYFCAVGEGRERYDSVAGERDTETYRDDVAAFLVHEEGPQAFNPDNPQSDGVFSQYFTASDGTPTPFGLMEKEWRLLNDQVFATIVVLTNERGKVDELERFGVEPAEVVARTLANRSRAAAGCGIPAVETGTGSTGAGKGGKGGIPVQVTAIGGITAIVLGGITIWRRKAGKAAPPSRTVAGSVPPQCRHIADMYDDEVRKLDVLREAEVDLGERLKRAETIHRNNLIKARMVVNIEIISVVAGTATDLAVALRPAVLRRAGPPAMGQIDSWKPPMGSKWAQRIKAAEDAARAAWGKFQSLAAVAEQLLAPIEERVRNLPSVKNAQQMWEFHMHRLGEMISDLPKANAARAKLVELDHVIETTTQRVRAFEQGPVSQAKAAVAQAESVLHAKRNALPPDFKYAQDLLSEAQQELAKLHARGVEDTKILAKAEDYVEFAQGKVRTATKEAGALVNEIPAAEKALATAQAALATAEGQLETLSREMTSATSRRQTTYNKLVTQLGDLTVADIDRQGRIAGQAQRELTEATTAGRQELGKELAAAREARNKAEVEAAAAQGVLEDLRGQSMNDVLGKNLPTEGGIGAAVGKAISWASAPIRYGLTIASEIVLGVGQSPKEIVQILVQGRNNVQLLREHLGTVRRAAFEQQRRVQQVKRVLDACTHGPPVQSDIPLGAMENAA